MNKCFNKTCPFRNNIGIDKNDCSCIACPRRVPENYYITYSTDTTNTASTKLKEELNKTQNNMTGINVSRYN